MEEQLKKPSKTTSKPKTTISKHHALLALVVIVMSVLSFALGVQYERNNSHELKATANTMPGLDQQSGNGFGGGFGGRGARGGQRGNIGEVTAISGSSITINSLRANTAQTYTITTNTKVTDAGQTSSVSAIKVGDNVVVEPSTSNSKEAGTILLNLNPGAPTGQTQSDTSTDSNPI